MHFFKYICPFDTLRNDGLIPHLHYCIRQNELLIYKKTKVFLIFCVDIYILNVIKILFVLFLCVLNKIMKVKIAYFVIKHSQTSWQETPQLFGP